MGEYFLDRFDLYNFNTEEEFYEYCNKEEKEQDYDNDTGCIHKYSGRA